MVNDEIGDALLLDSVVEAGEEREDEVVVADEGVSLVFEEKGKKMR